jgi:hypothetical protein
VGDGDGEESDDRFELTAFQKTANADYPDRDAVQAHIARII